MATKAKAKKKAEPKLSAASQKVIQAIPTENDNGACLNAVTKRLLQLEQQVPALKAPAK